VDIVATHARALAALQRNGSPVTFTLDLPGTQEPTTGRYAGAASVSVQGYAVQAKVDVMAEFLGDEAIEADTLNLFFVPETLGEVPPLGSSVSWSSDQYRVKRLRKVAPAGTAIGTYVVLA